jgi:deoxyribodipyrimidine photolyase-related protein
MMTRITLRLPHQLFEAVPGTEVCLVEEFRWFREFRYHRQKLSFQRASMRRHAVHLREAGATVKYVETEEETSDVRRLIPVLAGEGVTEIVLADPADEVWSRRLESAAVEAGIALEVHDSPLFLNDREYLDGYFDPARDRFSQTDFYRRERRRRGILLDDRGKPVGGKWTFDTENRRRFPKDGTPPSRPGAAITEFHREAVDYVAARFPSNPGEPEGPLVWPLDHDAARAWLRTFLSERFRDFGPYEDAIVAGEHVLHHGALTPMLNTGLLPPQVVLDEALAVAERDDVPLNSLEGFVRQVMGWREFVHGVYRAKGDEQRTRNFWGFVRPLPGGWWDGTTGIAPVDTIIRKLRATGYCHHIERLMVLGNFMLLSEFDPDDVYRWFMEMFIDAYDWVMVPNVYGMSQFADGGLMTTKPYLSGSNYLKKMSDFPPGEWRETWDALFWRFLHVHRDFFSGNPRLAMLLRTFDGWPKERRDRRLATADRYLASLDG